MELIAEKTRQFIVTTVSSYRSELPPVHVMFKVSRAIDSLLENDDAGQDAAMNKLYALCPDVESASTLRYIFISSRSSWHVSGKNMQVDFFAIPVYGDTQSIRSFIDSGLSFSDLADLPTRSGFFDNSKTAVALMKTAVPWNDFMLPSVIDSLSSAWIRAILDASSIDQAANNKLVSDFIDNLDSSAPRFGKSALLIPGIRVINDYKSKDKDTLLSWDYISPVEKNVYRMLWRQMSFKITADAGIQNGSVLIGLPATLLSAQSQSIAWNMVEQVYSRTPKNRQIAEVITSSFDPVKKSYDQIMLKAVDSSGIVIAQSDKISLFDACGSSKDFSETIERECAPKGPDTRTAEMAFSKIYNSINVKRLPPPN